MDKLHSSNSPIFIIASERSGTNLLRRRLSEWQKVAYGPTPLHLLKHLYHAQPFYGDLSKKSVLNKFLDDAIGLANNHFSPWMISLTPEDIIQWHRRHWDNSLSAVSVMHAMNTIYAQEQGYETYICKDNNLFDYYYPIATEIPSSRFIYIYRDPRDVVASQLNRPTQDKSVIRMATLWRDEQIKSIQAIKSHILSENKVFSISYEKFVAKEEESIKNICDAIGIKGFNRDINKRVYQEELADIQEWKNLNKPTTTGSIGRYKTQLKQAQIKMIESIVWHQMIYLKYNPEFSKRPYTDRIHVVMEKFASAIKNKMSHRVNRKLITDGQKERQKYINKIKLERYI